MNTSFSAEFKKWIAQPYAGAENMSVVQWFLLAGLAILICASWRTILKHIEG